MKLIECIYLAAKTGFHDLQVKYEYFHILVLLKN